MKLRTAILSISDTEINGFLDRLDLPVDRITVQSIDGRMAVQVKKGITIKFSIVFGCDGRHVTATVDAGALGNPVAGMVLNRILDNISGWGVSLSGRTIVFDPRAAMTRAGIQGDFIVEKIATGSGELVMAIEGDVPVDQFMAEIAVED